MPTIIGLSGLAGSGKTEAASMLESKGYTRLSFATPLKRMLEVLVPPGTDKNDRPPLLQGKTYREALQTLGTDWGRCMISKEIWCGAAMHFADELLKDGQSVVFDDVRFDNEAKAIIERGGQVIEIIRPGVTGMAHASEAGLSRELVNAVVHNDSTVEYLHERLGYVLASIARADEVERMLENRHTTYLKWMEPWQACGPEGNDLDAHVELRATVHDCINMERLTCRAAGTPTVGNDRDRLLDFIAIHWASVVKD